MSTWRCCDVCPCYHRPTETCYRDRDDLRHVEDPKVCPNWCPQETRSPLPRKGKFPYYKPTCEGCRWDMANSALACCECQNNLVFPQSAESGECPMKDSYMQDLIGKWGHGLVPMVTTRYAEIIVRGINEGDHSFWGINFMNCRQLNSYLSGGQVRGFFLQEHWGRMLVSLTQMRSKGAYAMAKIAVDHAEIDGKGVLKLFSGYKGTWDYDGIVHVMICDEPTPDSAFVGTHCVEEAEEETEDCEVCRPVTRSKIASLEEFL